MARLPTIRCRLAGASAMWLAAGLWLAATAPANAQQAGGLRGSITESDVNADIVSPYGQNTKSIDGLTTSSLKGAYEPISPGALPEAGTDTVPVRNAGSDLFAAESDPAVRTAPSGLVTDRNETVAPQARQAETVDENDPLTGTIRVRPAEAVDSGDEGIAQRMNQRVGAIETRNRQDDTDNPYEPLGLRVGTFTVVPTLEQGLEWSSNADAVPKGESAFLSNTTLRLDAQSDWSRHSAAIQAYGTWREAISGADVSDIEGGVDADLRLDFSNDLQGLASLGYNVAPEDASSPVIIANVRDRPLRQSINGGLGLEKSAGKLRLGLFGDASRDQYGDATLEDGSILSQNDRNSTLLTTRLRGGYAISPAIAPFVEGEVGRRIYDETRDSSGYERSATRLGARAGVTLDLREKLTGEASIGWISENPDDARLAAISGLSAAANLSWSPMRGTIVAFDGSTTVETTSDPGESGSLLYWGQLSIERQIRDNLTGAALAGAAWRDYSAGGSEWTLFGEASLTWWLNRNLGVIGRVRHERLTSGLEGRDYAVNSVFLGMKLQR